LILTGHKNADFTCLDVHFTTHAVIEWESDKTKHVLAKPDPKVSSITLMAHFNSTNALDDIAIVWAALQSLQQAKDTDVRRITALEAENQKLRQDLDKLQDGYAALKLSHQDLSFSFGALETTVEKNTEEHEESVNNELEEIREDVKKLDNQFCFLGQH
jgi:translation elongation factor EF-1beta